MQDSRSITTDQPAPASDMSGTNRIGGRNLRRRESVEPLGVASEELVLELGSRSLITRFAVPMQSGQVESECG